MPEYESGDFEDLNHNLIERGELLGLFNVQERDAVSRMLKFH